MYDDDNDDDDGIIIADSRDSIGHEKHIYFRVFFAK